MYILITLGEWGRSRLRTFGSAAPGLDEDYFADWSAQTYGVESDIYPSWWAS
jgi:hypothetical protein